MDFYGSLITRFSTNHEAVDMPRITDRDATPGDGRSIRFPLQGVRASALEFSRLRGDERRNEVEFTWPFIDAT